MENDNSTSGEKRGKMRKMTLGQHLEELRVRIIISLVGTIIAAAFFMFSRDFTVGIALQPYSRTWNWLVAEWMENLEEGHTAGTLTKVEEENFRWVFGTKDRATGKYVGGVKEDILAQKVKDGVMKGRGFPYPKTLTQLAPIEFFIAWMKLAVIFGLLVASPLVFHQIWRFIAAGLFESEREKIMKCFPYAVFLFITGCAFSYFVVVPYALFFLAGLSGEFINQSYSVRAYVSFFFPLTLGLGVIFQLPLVMVGLSRFGIVKAATFSKKRKIFVICAFVTGALFSPPDPFTQVFMAGPILVLFEIGLIFARRSERRSAVEMAESESEEA